MTSSGTPSYDELFGIDPEAQAVSASMNSMVRRMRDSKASRPLGALTGQASSVQPPEVAERLARALTEAEAAHRSGYGVDEAEKVLSEALTAAQTDREIREGVRDAKTGQFIQAPSGFDGGVRGRKAGPAPPGGSRQEEGPNALFRRAIQASHESAREQGKGLGRMDGIVVANS